MEMGGLMLRFHHLYCMAIYEYIEKLVKSVARRSGKVCLGGMVEMQVLYGIIALDLDALLCLALGAAVLVDHR